MAIQKLIFLFSVPVRLSPIHAADKVEPWVKFSNISNRNMSYFVGHLPFWSASRFYHRGHPISIKTFCFAEINNVENDSLKKKEEEGNQKIVLCKLLLPDN